MDRERLGRLVLNTDALGCLGAGAAVSSAPSVYRFVDSSGTSRPFVAAALMLSSRLLRPAAGRPPGPALRRGALLNLAWVLLCLAVLPKQRTAVGRSLVASTALLDATMAVVQWRLASAGQKRP
ncbi:hypothetical protein KIH74_15985 [Kineosporia sp. J2-2]|uniref:Uncharacterized protein n=1 Tax=Kineosporia corallincola TaxID=2835133 RepID=A0ABS5TJ67_9ACTN|nr:hypothetical protein [Kineosporia corallincola]MBT0770444.1 hypothetical protein [Kineosporia corallincola]